MSDFELMQLIARGNTRAFESLVLKYQSLVFGLANKYLNNREKAEDMSQDVWIKIAETAEHFLPQAKANHLAKSWITTITRNMCLNQLKSSYSQTLPMPEGFDAAADGPLAHEILEMFESKEQINKLIASLDPLARSVLLLFTTEEKTLSEIAELTGLTISNVKVTLHRTREKIRKEFKSNE